MMGQEQNRFFESVLFQFTGQEIKVDSLHFVSGGCISNTVLLETSQGKFFLKWSEADDEEMFTAEARGLEILRKAGNLRIPEVLAYGKHEERAYLLLEYIQSVRKKPDFWQDFGRKLAALHRHTQPEYGLDDDNFIGSLPQNNTPASSWVDFFIERRLNAQLGLAFYNGIIDQAFVDRFKQLYPKLYDLLPEEQPALLHGDLWSGNVMDDDKGEVCLIDPAVYYGHREIELSFTKLFGGFEPAFYQAYHEAFPLQPGFEERVAIYNLYPLLVHVNLFGTSYLGGVSRTLDKYLR